MDINIAEPRRGHSFQSVGTEQASNTVSSGALYRISAIAGVGSAIILLVNAAKRAALIPATDLTQLLAPLAEVLALGVVVGLFMAFGRRSGLFGVLAFITNFIALACLEGVEVAINLVFAKAPVETIVELRAGPLGLMLTVTSLLFLIGSIAFVMSMVPSKGVSRVALALYGIAVVPIAFRAFVPELALDLGLATLAVAIAWLSTSLWSHARNLSVVAAE